MVMGDPRMRPSIILWAAWGALLGAALPAAGYLPQGSPPLQPTVTHPMPGVTPLMGPSPLGWSNPERNLPGLEPTPGLRSGWGEEAGPAPEPTLAAPAPGAEVAVPTPWRPLAVPTPRPSLKSYPTPDERPSSKPTAAAGAIPQDPHPDYAALGGLLEQLAKDQASLKLLLASGGGGLQGLDPARQAQAQALLKRLDATEALLQSRLKSAPLPLPVSTPASAKPYATSTPRPQP